MNVELMPHQVDGAGFLSDREAGLLYWDAGAGKTYAAVRGCDLAYEKNVAEKIVPGQILALTPAVNRRNLANEFTKSQARDREIAVIEKGTDTFDHADVIISSYDLAAKRAVWERLMALTFDVLILDELQYLKTPTSARARAVFGGNGYGRDGLFGRAIQTWALSGTPAPNNITELFPWIRATRPDLLAGLRPGGRVTLDDFKRAFCKCVDTPYGLKIVGNRDAEVRQLWARLRGDVSRIHKHDVIEDLPPVTFHDYEVMGDKTASKVRKLEAEYREQIEMLLRDVSGTGVYDEHITTMRRVTEMAKVGDCIEIVKAELADGAMQKVVIFANYKDTITSLREALHEFNPVVIRGDVTPLRRQQAIEAFHGDDDVRVFIGQIVAAGTAITLHADGKCSDVIFVSADWVPANNAQAVARVHRKGQHNNVHARFLHLANSLDEQVSRTLMHKTFTLNKALDERKTHHAS